MLPGPTLPPNQNHRRDRSRSQQCAPNRPGKLLQLRLRHLAARLIVNMFYEGCRFRPCSFDLPMNERNNMPSISHNNHKLLSETAYLLLRVVTGLLFLQAGGLKLFSWFGGMPGGLKLELMSQVGIGGILEFFGGLGILLGLFTRPIAFILREKWPSPTGS